MQATITEKLAVSSDDHSSQRHHPPNRGYYPPVGTKLPHVIEGFLSDPAVGGAPVVAYERNGW